MNWKFKIKDIPGFLFIILSLSACLTEDETNELKFKPVTVVTAAVTSVTTNSAIAGGTITAPQERNVARGVCWSTNPNPEITLATKTTNGTGLGSFSSSITGLAANTTYYVRAYATSSLSTVYGNQAILKTSMPVLATISTNAVSAISSTTAISGGNITSDGGATITARGVCWSTTANPTISNSKTSNGTGTGSFTSSLTGLVVGTTYFVRAYATNSLGTVYGTQQTFSTTNLPALTTIAVSNITTVSALGGGNISSDGGSTILSCGVCWSTTSNPTTANSTATASGIGIGFTGGYTLSLTLLLPNTTYYIRAFATNIVGTAYGNQISFTTSPLITLPIISTTSATSITTTTANSGGNITSDGGAIVTARGVCWSTSTNPTLTNSKTSNSSGTGSFTSSITGLSAGTIYYVRAYATNSVGTAYGSQVSFSTTSITLPTITTTAITAISTSGCSSGGNITSDGGSTVTARGVCWSTSSTPTITNNKTINGTGSGSFTSSITELVSGTTYYVRAYATNSVGTIYGSQVNFTTLNNSGNDFGEPNNSSSTATVINPTSTTNASIGFNSDQYDWYKVNIVSDGEFKVTLSNTNATSVINGAIGQASIYKNSTTSPLDNLSYIYNGSSGTSSTFNLSAGDIIYIQIPRLGTNWANYSLVCSFVSKSVSDFGEPNNSSSTATVINPTSTTNASIGFNSDQYDWYKVNIVSDGEFKVTLSNTNATSVINGAIGQASIYKNSTTSPLDNLSYIYNGSSGTSSTFNLSAGDIIYIQIPRLGTNWANYSLVCSFVSKSVSDFGEPNNSSSTATVINPTSTTNASIGFNSDQYDWYKVNIVSDGEFKVTLSNTNATSVINGAIGQASIYKNSTTSPLDNLSYIYNGSSGTSSTFNLSAGDIIYIQIPRLGTNWATYSLALYFTKM